MISLTHSGLGLAYRTKNLGFLVTNIMIDRGECLDAEKYFTEYTVF